MDPVYAEIVKKTSGYTAKGVKGFFEEMYETKFASLKVEGSTVTFRRQIGRASCRERV